MSLAGTAMPFGRRLQRIAEDFVIEFVQLFGFILILSLGERAVHRFFGDSRAFGIVPMEWFFQAGDIGLVLCFSFRACKQLLSHGRE